MIFFKRKSKVIEASAVVAAAPVIDPARYVREDWSEKMFEAAGIEMPLPRWDAPDIKHLDGVPWYDAPVPPKRHECWPQTDGWIGLDRVQRCACGAIRGHGYREWDDRNSRTA